MIGGVSISIDYSATTMYCDEGNDTIYYVDIAYGGNGSDTIQLYLKGISTGQFEEALAALLGTDAPGLSPTTVRRLTAAWQDEHERWRQRDLSARRYVYLWADGVYFTPRLEHDRQCILVVIGADMQGRKELLAIEDGFRESAQSWRELLLRLRDQNGFEFDPELATGDGSLGFWRALHEI